MPQFPLVRPGAILDLSDKDRLDEDRHSPFECYGRRSIPSSSFRSSRESSLDQPVPQPPTETICPSFHAPSSSRPRWPGKVDGSKPTTTSYPGACR